MKLPRITQLVKNVAAFQRYQDGNLWYRIVWEEDDHSSTHNFDFPIPIDDAGGGEFLPTDMGMTFMRWIRKHLEFLGTALKEAGDE